MGLVMRVLLLATSAGAVAIVGLLGLGSAGAASKQGSGCLAHRGAYVEDVVEIQ